MSLNIYNPTTQQLTEVAGLDVKDSLEKVATLPTPTADYLNQVYILVGTQEGYHVGSIYQCRYINSAYTWVEITGSVVNKADKAPNATNNHLAKLTADGNLADSGIAVGDLGTAINKNWTDLVRPNSHDLVESNAVYSAITNAISSIYTPHGDITCAELVPALLIEENIGNVYTVTDSGTTTAYFMQGAGKTINVGDSVSIIKAGEDTILFNLMGNVLDLTDYQKKNLSTAIEIGGVDKTTVEDALNGLNDHEEEDIEGIWKANGELGVKNLLLNKATTQTVNGVTFTVNTDGTVLVDGTATATIQFELNPSVYVGTGNKIIISGCPNVDSEYNIRLRLTEENTPTYVIDDIGESVTYEATADKYGCRIIIFNGYTANNILFKPMIRLASDPDDTYQPYAMTNRELTVTSYTDNSVYVSRTSKGDLVDMSLIGGTVAWNQIIMPQAVDEYTTEYNGVTYTVYPNGSIRLNGTATQSYWLSTAIDSSKRPKYNKMYPNHVILFLYTFSNPIRVVNNRQIGSSMSGYYPTIVTETLIGTCIIKNEYEDTSGVQMRILENDTFSDVILYPKCFDLTLMFGTTIADYVYNLEQSVGGSGIAWLQSYGFFTKDYYAYDAGSLLSVNTKGRKITSGSESTTYAIDPIDLRGIPKLVNNKLNYNGDIYKANGVITRKYGIVDLGTLDWTYNSTAQRFITMDLASLIKNMPNQNLANLFCARYVSTTNSSTNKSIWNGWSGQINIKDADYTDAATFKTAMSGVYLVYELATQTTEIVSPYINPQRVYDGGTEEFLRDSAPIIPVGVEAEYYNNKTSVLATEYTDSVGNSKVDWKSNGIIGAKNLDGTTRNSQTVNGIVYTVNSDETVTANGTASATSQLDIGHNALSFTASFSAQVILTGGIADGIEIYPWDYTSDTRPYTDATKTTRLPSSSNSRGDNEVSFYMEKGHQYLMCIRITSGKTVSDAIFKPLLRLATDPDNTYVPYAMTNQQLTKYIDATTLPVSIVTSSVGTVQTANVNLVKSGNILTYKISISGLTISANTWTSIGHFDGLVSIGNFLGTANANDTTFGIASLEKKSGYIDIKVKFTTAITNGFVLVYGQLVLES